MAFSFRLPQFFLPSILLWISIAVMECDFSSCVAFSFFLSPIWPDCSLLAYSLSFLPPLGFRDFYGPLHAPQFIQLFPNLTFIFENWAGCRCRWDRDYPMVFQGFKSPPGNYFFFIFSLCCNFHVP